MLFGLLSFVFGFLMIFMILIILVQKGKGSLGIGNMGGGNQMLFGGTGGQDLFQKVTWILGTILIVGSLGLAIWKTKIIGVSTELLHRPAPTQQTPSSQPSQDQAPE